MVSIVQKDDPVLRKIAKPVPVSWFGSAKLGKVLADMSEALASQDDGVAIAAPQIGQSLRIFVVSGSVIEYMRAGSIDEPSAEEAVENGAEEKTPKLPDLVFINPEIVRLSKEKEEMEEGCLSVRYLYGKTQRSKKARVRAYDADGKEFELGASGLFAQIFQHEIDHLDGRLFIDIATDIQDLPPRKTRRTSTSFSRTSDGTIA